MALSPAKMGFHERKTILLCNPCTTHWDLWLAYCGATGNREQRREHDTGNQQRNNEKIRRHQRRLSKASTDEAGNHFAPVFSNRQHNWEVNKATVCTISTIECFVSKINYVNFIKYVEKPWWRNGGVSDPYLFVTFFRPFFKLKLYL